MPRTDPELDRRDALVKTYRYLRAALVVLIVILGASIAVEWRRTAGDCLQGSISAYYYTPVRTIFVGVLLAMGLGLVAIKGNSKWEDTALNLAGMLAPIVAVVPTSDLGTCSSVPEAVRSTAPGISNNFIAVVVGGIVAVVAGAGTALLDERRHRDGGIERPTWVGLGVAAALLAGAVAWYNLWHGSFLEGAHFTAAITMFVFVGWAAGTNGWSIPRTARVARPWTWLGRKRGGWARAYRCIPIGMAVTGLLTVAVTAGTRHTVFWLEVVEIAWFVAFWVLQTVEQWDDGIRTETSSAASAA